MLQERLKQSATTAERVSNEDWLRLALLGLALLTRHRIDYKGAADTAA